MRNQKGYSLLELLSVAVIMSLIIALFTFWALGEIDRARGSTLVSNARMVYISANTVIVECEAYTEEISDKDYEAGLSGTVRDASRPVVSRVSEMMRAHVEPDIILAEEPSAGEASASFTVEDGKILSMTYKTMLGKRGYSVTISGAEAKVERLK